MVRAVLFDLDGVLIDSEEAWFQAMVEATEVFDSPPLSREEFAGAFGQSIADDVRDFYPGREVEEVEGWLVANFGRFAPHVRYDPDATAVFAALAQRGVRVAVVTNTPGELARRLLARGGLAAETVIGSDDVPRPKPAPDCVHAALAALEVAAAEAVLVGDSRFDQEAAQGAGVRFIGYRIAGDRRIDTLPELVRLCDGEP